MVAFIDQLKDIPDHLYTSEISGNSNDSDLDENYVSAALRDLSSCEDEQRKWDPRGRCWTIEWYTSKES